MILKFVIALAPVTKKNHQEIHYKGKRCPVCRKGGIPFVAQGKAYQDYERACLAAFPQDIRLHIKQPVNIKALYYMPSARRVDISNLHSALHDVLVKAGVLADDSSLSPKIVAGTDGSRVYIDRKNPRTEVEITEVIEC